MIPAATPGPLQLQLTQSGCPGQAVTAVSRTRAQLRTRDTHARLFPCSASLYTVLSKLLQCEIASLLMGSLQGQLRRRRPRPRPRTSTVQHQATRRSTDHGRLTLRLGWSARPCRFKRSRCRKFDPHRPFSKQTFEMWSSGQEFQTIIHIHT